MPLSLQDLEQQRSAIVRQLAELGDFRQRGHGPADRLTYKFAGKTVIEALPSPAALSKAEREVAEFRKFQQLSQRFVEINTRICRLRRRET